MGAALCRLVEQLRSRYLRPEGRRLAVNPGERAALAGV